jgi:T4-like virus Myoviridae tail sheath stabiliser
MSVPSNYFYDGQIRRFVSQFIRLVSNFYVEFGQDSSGAINYQRVPVMYGDQSRQAAQILRNNSENTINAVPAMAVYVNGLSYDLSRLQDPSLVQTLQVRQRDYDPVTGTYGNSQGEAYTIERMMPTPFKLTLKLDVWTSNTEQKLQLIEQLVTMFNPALEIQNSDNYLDWSSLSYALLTDTNWTSRSVPTGGEDPIDIATLTFELPIWISTNIKVKKMGVIQTVITNMQDLSTLANLGQVITTVGNYGVLLSTSPSGNSLKLIKHDDIITNDAFNNDVVSAGTSYAWAPLLDEYGKFKSNGAGFISGSSQVRLTQPDGSEIIGTVATNPTDATLLIFSPFADTLPTNTLDAVTAIIDPLSVNITTSITRPTSGTRYLVINNINSTEPLTAAWKGTDSVDLVANANDIIQYNGSHWTVAFDSQSVNTLQYATNLTTGIQYKWQNQMWVKSYDGVYQPGEWMLAI